MTKDSPNDSSAKRPRSGELFERACRFIPGGVNSPVRAFRAVGTTPVFAVRARGAELVDADGKHYIDYIGAWGPLLLGQGHADVERYVRQAFERGTAFGLSTEAEVRLAELITEAVPSIEKVRLVNSGTEAAMSAIRLARGFTGRDLVLKFDGCYHGHVDSLLVKAGSGVATLALPDSAGVPAQYAQTTLTAPYNDAAAVQRIFAAHPGKIAAVIVEPVAGNMGCVLPAEGFLTTLRDCTASDGALLIFDEVITGFRLAVGGAQELFGSTPDLTILGKVIGGGLPIGAYGGRADIMDHIAPLGPVYQAGTLAGNPLAVAAGIAVLEELRRRNSLYSELDARTQRLADGLKRAAWDAHVDVCLNRIGSMLTVFFTRGPVVDFDSASRADRDLFALFFQGMLDRGVLLPPSQFETWFVSAAHTDRDVDMTVKAAREAFLWAAEESAKQLV
jgi:glutamate-1-semialdehyde 2,1-aminomutase